MKRREYEAWVARRRNEVLSPITYDMIALAGEVGEIASVIKKLDNRVYSRVEDYREDILLECGDALHYLARLLHDHGFSLHDAIEANVEKLTNREKYGKGKRGKRS